MTDFFFLEISFTSRMFSEMVIDKDMKLLESIDF